MNAPLSDAILARIDSQSVRKMELDLERLPALLERLGDPLDRLPPVIHVAGTNGKGSVVAFLRAMLRHAGLDVQCFTSPHLHRVTEEVALSGGEIRDAEFARHLLRVEDANDGGVLSSFEALTAAAFLAFAEDTADVLLLETAMGGRLDATNVVRQPALTVITPIALDHMAYLGDTIAEIAAEKAGILKPGAACVAGPEHPDAVAVVEHRARALQVPLRLAGRDFTVDPESGLYSGLSEIALPAPGLAGGHQWRNAALAVAALESFRPGLLPEAAAGLADARWPARMQRLDIEGREIWVDGGHNAHAAAAMAGALQALPPKPLCLIVGMLDSRPVAPFLAAFETLRPLVIGVAAGRQPVYTAGRPHPPEEIAFAAGRLGLQARVAGSLAEAVEIARRERGAPRTLVTGSLYLAAEMLAEADPPIA
ncbi:MAG: hypothetical protein TEF_05170 [Rhizobiales bacterium NRL2]|nr:MAG: hypothetical protein TEF_05170 [Rhizobiales bacterium NRL2]